jgi:hypothetical protein
MQFAKTGRVIGRDSNVVLVDFSREPEPPVPRFPGAVGLRATRHEETDLEPRSLAVRAAGWPRMKSLHIDGANN